MIINSLTQMMSTVPLLAAGQSLTSPPDIDIIPYPTYNGDNWDEFIFIANTNRKLMNHLMDQEHPAFQRDQIEERHLRSALVALASSDTFQIQTDEVDQEKMFSQVCDIIIDRYSSDFALRYCVCFFLGIGITVIGSSGLALYPQTQDTYKYLIGFLFGMILAWLPRFALQRWDKAHHTKNNVTLATKMGFYTWFAALATYLGTHLLPYHYSAFPTPLVSGILFTSPIGYKIITTLSARRDELNQIMEEFKEGKLISSSHSKRTKTP